MKSLKNFIAESANTKYIKDGLYLVGEGAVTVCSNKTKFMKSVKSDSEFPEDYMLDVPEGSKIEVTLLKSETYQEAGMNFYSVKCIHLGDGDTSLYNDSVEETKIYWGIDETVFGAGTTSFIK